MMRERQRVRQRGRRDERVPLLVGIRERRSGRLLSCFDRLFVSDVFSFSFSCIFRISLWLKQLLCFDLLTVFTTCGTLPFGLQCQRIFEWLQEKLQIDICSRLWVTLLPQLHNSLSPIPHHLPLLLQNHQPAICLSLYNFFWSAFFFFASSSPLLILTFRLCICLLAGRCWSWEFRTCLALQASSSLISQQFLSRSALLQRMPHLGFTSIEGIWWNLSVMLTLSSLMRHLLVRPFKSRWGAFVFLILTSCLLLVFAKTVIVVVSSADDSPVSLFEKLATIPSLPLLFRQGFYDAMNLTKGYLLVHDKQSPELLDQYESFFTHLAWLACFHLLFVCVFGFRSELLQFLVTWRKPFQLAFVVCCGSIHCLRLQRPQTCGLNFFSLLIMKCHLQHLFLPRLIRWLVFVAKVFLRYHQILTLLEYERELHPVPLSLLYPPLLPLSLVLDLLPLRLLLHLPPRLLRLLPFPQRDHQLFFAPSHLCHLSRLALLLFFFQLHFHLSIVVVIYRKKIGWPSTHSFLILPRNVSCRTWRKLFDLWIHRFALFCSWFSCPAFALHIVDSWSHTGLLFVFTFHLLFFFCVFAWSFSSLCLSFLLWSWVCRSLSRSFFALSCSLLLRFRLHVEDFATAFRHFSEPNLLLALLAVFLLLFMS